MHVVAMYLGLCLSVSLKTRIATAFFDHDNCVQSCYGEREGGAQFHSVNK